MAIDRTSLRLEQDGDVSETVLTTAEDCLQLYDLLLSATKINHYDSDRIHLATCLCLCLLPAEDSASYDSGPHLDSGRSRR